MVAFDNSPQPPLQSEQQQPSEAVSGRENTPRIDQHGYLVRPPSGVLTLSSLDQVVPAFRDPAVRGVIVQRGLEEQLTLLAGLVSLVSDHKIEIKDPDGTYTVEGYIRAVNTAREHFEKSFPEEDHSAAFEFLAREGSELGEIMRELTRNPNGAVGCHTQNVNYGNYFAHKHGGMPNFFGTIAYTRVGTELYEGDKEENPFQAPPLAFVVGRGPVLLHRTPPPENPLRPYRSVGSGPNEFLTDRLVSVFSCIESV